MQYNITYRQKDKGWQYIISYKDAKGAWKQKSKQGFGTKKTAKKAAEERLEQLKKEVEAAIRVEPQYRGITFGEFAKELLEHERLYKAYNTIQRRQTAVNRFKNIKDMPIASIKHSDIQKCVDSLIVEGLKISTIDTYLASISYVLGQAVDPYKIISKNPIEKIKMPSMQYKEEDVRNSCMALNKQEVASLLNHFKNSPKLNKYYYLCSFALATGLREGELMGLTWDDIDFLNRKVYVRKQWKKTDKDNYGFGTVKRKNSIRAVPLSNNTINLMREYKNIYNVVGLNNKMFPFRNQSVVAILNIVSKRLGFKVTMHMLRHTYATNLIANGMDFKTVAKLLGHSVEMTIKKYSHVTDDMMQRATDKINIIF